MATLWLALRFPRLPLEALSGLAAPAAVAAQARILACDDQALAAGVRPGMGTAAARAIEPRLSVAPHDPAHEAATLEALACWAGRLTPCISLAPPDALLLEIGPSLRLFGGAEAIRDQAVAGCAAQGFSTWAAVAPAPQGALWLAGAGCALICPDHVALAVALDGLPLAAVPLERAALERLTAFGVHRLGEVRALPRAGLARRIGAAAVDALTRAYGERPDPRTEFVFPERFAQAIEFPAPVEQATALLFVGRRLTAALAGWLAARQAAVRGCTLRLSHPHRADSLLPLRLAGPTRDPERFERLLRERLEGHALDAAVERVALEADAVEPLPGYSGDLFAGAGGEDGLAALIERLRGRLGEDRVYGIRAVADHRPECATRRVEEGDNGAAVVLGPQPVWLLAAPEPLKESDGRPWLGGPLELLAGPARIEAGWWDGGEGGGDQRRDYFVTLTAGARWAWVYRRIDGAGDGPGGWFLQGWFG